MTVYREICLRRAMSCDISLEACLVRKNLAIFHDAVSSDGAAWCSRTYLGSQILVGAWLEDQRALLDRSWTHSIINVPLLKPIKMYQVISSDSNAIQIVMPKNAKPPNLQKVHNEKLQLLQDAKASRRLWSRSWRLERSWGPARAASPKIWV